MGDLLRQLVDRTAGATDVEPPTTGRVVKVTSEGPWVVPLDGDERHPVGPCRGPAGVQRHDIVLLVYTDEAPWIAAVDRS